MKKRGFFIAVFLAFCFLPAASAGTMELSNAGNKIILSITENSINIAAGKIYMDISESLTLYQPNGTGFFKNLYDIKGNNSNLEFQFFDFNAASKSGQFEIPFSAPAGTYTARVVKIELYNKSDFLIPFNYPLETVITLYTQATQPPEESKISPGSSGGTITPPTIPEEIPQTQPPTQPSSSGIAKEIKKEQTGNKTITNITQEQKKAETNVPVVIIFAISGASLLVLLWLLISEVIHKIMHVKAQHAQHLLINYK